MTTFAVIGSGAIGGWYGAQLAAAGNDVHFMFRHDADHVRENGLNVVSPKGDFVIESPLTHSSYDTIEPVDVVIVAAKAGANADIAGQLPPIVKEGGTVVVIQNGINAEPIFADALEGKATIIGAAAFVAVVRSGRNEITHFDFGLLNLGQYADGYEVTGVTERMKELGELFTAAGIEVQLNDDLLLDRWLKLLWNASYNPLSVILNADTGEMAKSEAIDELAATIMEELRAAAAADNRVIPPEMVSMLITGTKYMKPYSTSMKVDLENGRPVEADAIVGEPLKRAAANGVPMPATAAIYQQLQFINERLRAAQ